MIAELQGASCLAHAARNWLPKSRTGNDTHPSVLTRWSDRGVIAANGERVYLQTWRVGGQRMTTQIAIETFLAALNAGAPSGQQASEADAARKSSAAGNALEKLGC